MAKDKRKGISFNDWEKSLEQKRFAALYLFFGGEEFLVDEALGRLINTALDESSRSFNLDIVYGGDVDAKDIVALASAFPMMTERRVVAVKETDKISHKDGLLPYLERPCASTILCFVSPKPDFRVKFFRTLESVATLVNCTPVGDSEIAGWVRRRAGQLKKEIEPEACQLIQARVGNSLYEVFNEIDKVAIYVGEKKTITADDVDAVIGMSREFNIFQLQKAVGQRNVKRSTEILNRMLQTGESPLGIIVMLTRFFQKVWLTQELLAQSRPKSEIVAALGVYFSHADDYVTSARVYEETQLSRAFTALLEADESLKSSGTDPGLVMISMLIRILRSDNSLLVA